MRTNAITLGGSIVLHGLGEAVLVTLGACSQPQIAPDLSSDVPQERILGLAEATRQNDPSAAKEYVVMLDSSDPAVRMFAIGALKRMTGETKGYDFAAPRAQAGRAVSAPGPRGSRPGGPQPGGGDRPRPPAQ